MSKTEDLVFLASQSPEEISSNLIEKLIKPLIRQKQAHEGEALAAQICFNLIYALGKERVLMAGYDAIHELSGITTELEEECFGTEILPEPFEAVDLSGFTEMSYTRH
ncbi:hypothetical protein J2X86_002483 [Acinetobacter lwoffii]|jgi:hypothetical protein|uniref:Uncharacterized protein n=1 Tax=Acinetobacter lwoffii TaxID=28090 RepID=A0AAW8LK57_ACILW|nr:hypothetical protein [Acinetobacter lwoffii]MDR6630428.1 hypothetical protein [Acinetobacter lwoffii]